MSICEFSSKLIDLIKPQSAVRLIPENGFYPIRAGFVNHQSSTPSVLFSQPHYALVYLIKGSGQLRYLDGRTFSLRPGSLLQRFPDNQHFLDFPKGQTTVWAYMGIPTASVEALKTGNLVSTENPVLYVGCFDDVIRRYQTTINRIQTCPELKIASLINEMQQFAIDMISQARSRGGLTGNEEKVNNACEMLKTQIDQRIDIEVVASELNMSYSKFRKLFRQTLKISPGQYRINHRIEKACELLQKDTSSIENIGKILGYTDSATFSKQFKKITGTSPKEYRRQPDR